MLSRVADSIYWMARSMERAENMARLLVANRNLMLDAGVRQHEDSEFWQPILMTTGEEPAYHALHTEVRGDWVEDFLAFRPENPNSLLNCIRSARENARMIRDQITDEVWRSINDLYLLINSERGKTQRQQAPLEFYEQVMQSSSQFQGAAQATFMRDESWCFFQLGTYLERADKTSRLVDTCSGVPLVTPPHPDADPLRWQSLLRSCSAYHGYREYANHVDPRSVLEFLFLSDRFARSVRFCIQEVDKLISGLEPPPGAVAKYDPVRAIGRLRADLDFCTIDEIIETGLHCYIDNLQSRLNTVGEAIFQTFVLYADLTPISNSINLPAHSYVSGAAWPLDQASQIQQQQQQ